MSQEPVRPAADRQRVVRRRRYRWSLALLLIVAALAGGVSSGAAVGTGASGAGGDAAMTGTASAAVAEPLDRIASGDGRVVVEVSTRQGDQRTEVVVRLSNVGDADATAAVELRRDDAVVRSRQVTVPAGGTRQVTFRPAIEATYAVSVNGVQIETIRAGSVSTTRPSRSPGFGGIVGPVGIVVLAAVVAAAAIRYV